MVLLVFTVLKDVDDKQHAAARTWLPSLATKNLILIFRTSLLVLMLELIKLEPPWLISLSDQADSGLTGKPCNTVSARYTYHSCPRVLNPSIIFDIVRINPTWLQANPQSQSKNCGQLPSHFNWWTDEKFFAHYHSAFLPFYLFFFLSSWGDSN